MSIFRSALTIAFLIINSIAFSDTSYWVSPMVKSYVHNSELQRRWAISFLAPHLKGLGGNERILDIGCGDGKITADISRFVPQGTVTGIDPSLSMLHWAQRQYPFLEYPNLNFQEGGFSDLGTDTFDRIVSFCALQHFSDQEMAFKNMARALNLNGKLLILVPAMTNDALNKSRLMVQQKSQWQEYWQNYTPRKFLTPQKYIELLYSAGFTPIRVETVMTEDAFLNREELIDWLMGTFSPVVPEEKRRAFYEDWMDEYLRLDPEAMTDEGVICAKLGYIAIEARLQNNEEEMGKFVLIGKMRAKPGCEERLETALQALSKGTYTEPGCLFYALHRNAQDSTEFILVEGWTSKEALQAHFDAAHFLEHFPTISSLLVGEPELTYLDPLNKDLKGSLFRP